MVDKEERISLVAAYKQKNNELWYYRLADFDDHINKLVEAEYRTENWDDDFEPVTLYSKDYKDLYKTMLKKWKYDPYDNRKQYVKEHGVIHGKAYEIVFLEDEIEYKEYDEEYIRKALTDGFFVDESVNNEFLLIVGEKNNSYVALLCQKNRFKQKNIAIDDYTENHLYIDKNETDLLHTIVSLEMYKINKGSIIDITNLMDHPFSKGVIYECRYFYNEIKLPSNKSTFLVREVDDYTTSFFSAYFKEKKEIFEITNKEKSKFINILKSIENSEKELESFKTKTGYGLEEIKSTFSTIAKKTISELRADDELINIFRNYLLLDEDYYQECLDKVQIEWMNSNEFVSLKENLEKEHYTLKNKREKELTELLVELENSENELKTVKESFLEVENKTIVLNSEIIQLEEKKTQINKQIMDSVANYKNDIVSIMKDMAPLEFIKNTTPEISISKKYIHKKNKILDLNEKYAEVTSESYEDVMEFLTDNFSLYFSSDRSNDIAASILASIGTSKAIIVDEYNSEIVANCLALIIDKKIADKYYIQGTDVDVNRLVNSLSRNSNEVIYLEGILDSFNDTLVKTIIKLFPSKIFVFSVEEENLLSLPKGIYNFASYIETGSGFIGRQHEQLLISCMDTKKLRRELRNINEPSIKDRKLSKSKLLKDSQKIELNKVLYIYSSIIQCKDLPQFYVNQVILNSIKNEDDTFEDLRNIYSEELLAKTIYAEKLELL